MRDQKKGSADLEFGQESVQLRGVSKSITVDKNGDHCLTQSAACSLNVPEMRVGIWELCSVQH